MKYNNKNLSVSILYLTIVASYIVLKLILIRYSNLSEYVNKIIGYIYLYFFIMLPMLFYDKGTQRKSLRRISAFRLVNVFSKQTLSSIIALQFGYFITKLCGVLEFNTEVDLDAYNIIVMLILAPICEEIFFRKIFFDLCGNKNTIRMLVVNTIIFATPHLFSQGLPQVFYTLVLSFIWAKIYLEYNKIIYSIILHWGSNAIMLFNQYIEYSFFIKITIFIMIIIVLIGIIFNKEEHILQFTTYK